MNPCPCSSQKNYIDCCGRFLEGNEKPSTAEELMRSRYTAYTIQNIDYLINTTHSSVRKNQNRKDIETWAKESEWLKLEIVRTYLGNTQDKTGKVIFKAYYKHKSLSQVHEEDSTFKKENGEWFYLNGKEPEKQVVTTTQKIGRNDLCHCGSGKKFKKCCFNN